MAYAIKRSCENKAEVVSLDEKEGGLRATLNLGHTFGHVSFEFQTVICSFSVCLFGANSFLHLFDCSCVYLSYVNQEFCNVILVGSIHLKFLYVSEEFILLNGIIMWLGVWCITWYEARVAIFYDAERGELVADRYGKPYIET